LGEQRSILSLLEVLMTLNKINSKLDFTRHLKSPARDYWWHDDFLSLMQKRLKLDTLKNALDIGCGMGHWTRTILPFLEKDAKITGIDYNADWIKEAQKSETSSMIFKEGDACTLPFPDESFDFVTCQTLLMHLNQPEKALQEMYRVLKKGGVLFTAEPNNYTNLIRSNSAQDALSLEERVEHARLYALLEEGKKMSGDGFTSIFYKISGMLNTLNFKNIKTYRNDVVFSIYPPYEDKQQQSLIEMILDFEEQGYIYIYPRACGERYLDTACKDSVLKEKLINLSDKLFRLYKEQITNKIFEGMFAGEMIINTAIK